MSYSKKGNPQLISERKVDMSSFIGHYNAVCEIDLGKGILLKTQWNIIPACPKLHKAMISIEKKRMETKKIVEEEGKQEEKWEVPGSQEEEMEKLRKENEMLK